MEGKAKKYDRQMKTLWEELGKARKHPDEKSLWISPLSFRRYEQVRNFVSECFPNENLEILNLTFLPKLMEDLSVGELADWRINVTRLRGWLGKVQPGERQRSDLVLRKTGI